MLRSLDGALESVTRSVDIQFNSLSTLNPSFQKPRTRRILELRAAEIGRSKRRPLDFAVLGQNLSCSFVAERSHP